MVAQAARLRSLQVPDGPHSVPCAPSDRRFGTFATVIDLYHFLTSLNSLNSRLLVI
jgi:hypothetical protein